MEFLLSGCLLFVCWAPQAECSDCVYLAELHLQVHRRLAQLIQMDAAWEPFHCGLHM